MHRKARPETQQPAGARGSSSQPQTRLLRRPPSLAAVARAAASHDIGPRGRAPAGSGHDVVAGEILGLGLFAAVLAAETVASVDVLAGEFHVVLAEADVAQEPHHRRNPQRSVLGPDLPVRLLDHFDLLETDELESPLPVDDVERLERRVEYENLFEDALSFGTVVPARFCCEMYSKTTNGATANRVPAAAGRRSKKDVAPRPDSVNIKGELRFGASPPLAGSGAWR